MKPYNKQMPSNSNIETITILFVILTIILCL